jgi:hypothetical protein
MESAAKTVCQAGASERRAVVNRPAQWSLLRRRSDGGGGDVSDCRHDPTRRSIARSPVGKETPDDYQSPIARRPSDGPVANCEAANGRTAGRHFARCRGA